MNINIYIYMIYVLYIIRKFHWAETNAILVGANATVPASRDAAGVETPTSCRACTDYVWRLQSACVDKVRKGSSLYPLVMTNIAMV